MLNSVWIVPYVSDGPQHADCKQTIWFCHVLSNGKHRRRNDPGPVCSEAVTGDGSDQTGLSAYICFIPLIANATTKCWYTEY